MLESPLKGRAKCPPVRIRELVREWPLPIIPEHRTLTRASLQDGVIFVDQQTMPEECVILTLGSAAVRPYRVSLVLPKRFVDSALLKIRQKGRMTLKEVGDLELEL